MEKPTALRSRGGIRPLAVYLAALLLATRLGTSVVLRRGRSDARFSPGDLSCKDLVIILPPWPPTCIDALCARAAAKLGAAGPDVVRLAVARRAERLLQDAAEPVSEARRLLAASWIRAMSDRLLVDERETHFYLEARRRGEGFGDDEDVATETAATILTALTGRAITCSTTLGLRTLRPLGMVTERAPPLDLTSRPELRSDSSFSPPELAPSEFQSDASALKTARRIQASLPQLLGDVPSPASELHTEASPPTLRCSRCDAFGHASASCPFFSKPAFDHPDAISRGRGAHMRQISIRKQGSCIIIDGKLFRQGVATGSGNNCLIDTLRQALDLEEIPMAAVRQRLQLRFHDGLRRVRSSNLLTLEYHWAAVVAILLDMSKRKRLPADAYSVVCCTPDAIDHGDVLGSGDVKLYIARTGMRHGEEHFVPLHEVVDLGHCRQRLLSSLDTFSLPPPRRRLRLV